MLLYNWQKIFDEAEADASNVFRIFKMIVTDQLPINKHDKIYRFSHLSFLGQSFLVHPDVLLYNSYKHSHLEIAQYLATASLRSVTDYFATGKTELDIQKLEIEPTFIYENSLLDIKDNNVVFLYEEVPQEKNKWH
jgi:hypothetical protein